MGDINAGNSLFFQIGQEIHENIHFFVREGGGRLIQHQNLGIGGQPPEDSQHLHLPTV